MADDWLVARLRELRDEGELPHSRLTERGFAELATLFDTHVLEIERSGGGRRVILVRPRDFGRWVLTRFPLGLDQPSLDGLPPRAAAVAQFRDAKRAAVTIGQPVLVRVFDPSARVSWDDAPIGERLHEATQALGCGVVVLDDQHRWRIDGTVGVVENLESFLVAEHLGPHLDVAIYAAGRMSGRMLRWLGSPDATCRLVHLGDYDPVGLDEYLRLCTACPDRASLYVPDDLEALVERFGKAALLQKSTQVLARIRRVTDPDVRRVVATIDRHNRGLEQEALLLRGVKALGT